MPVTEHQNPDGTFKEGNNANPNGGNGNVTGWQKSGTRLQRWYAKPAKELKELAENLEKLEELTAIDVACARVVIGSMFGKETLAHFNAAMDRIEGKALQRNEFSGKDGGAITYADANAARQALLGRTVPGPTPADTGTEAEPTDEPPSSGTPA